MITILSIENAESALIRVKPSGIRSRRNVAGMRKAEIGLRRRLRLVFKQMAKQLSQEVLREFADVTRADPVLPDSLVGAIADLLKQKDFDKIVSLAEPYIVSTAVGGASGTSKSIEALGFDAHAKAAAQNAKLWGQHRAAELVGRKWVDGKLVDNPSAKWAINESTRNIIRGEVERAIRDGSTVSELAESLRGSVAFSEERALMVARTEMALADTAGTMESFKACADIVGKRWTTAGDDRVSDECQACEDEGAIPLDQAFSSGADAPPNHPNCRCAIVPVFEGEM